MAENQTDHDLLIVIAEGQKELKNDVRGISDQMREMKASLDATNERQRDQDNRLTNLTSTVVRLQADQRDERLDITKLRDDVDRKIAAISEDHGKKIGTINDDMTRWKLYLRVAVVLTTPVYLGMLALAIEAAKRYLFP